MLLKDLRQFLPTVHILCTSRYLSDIDCQFEECPRLEIRAQEADVRVYLKNRIDQEPRLKKHIQGDQLLFEDILDKIAGKSDGM